MGIFSNDTEEEKNLKKLVRAIKGSNLPQSWINFLSDYVNGVYNGSKNNDFFNADYLTRIILEITEIEDLDRKEPKVFFVELKNIVELLFPDGDKTENFDSMMELFIKHFCVKNGIVDKDLFDKNFYALFTNKYDYLYIIKIILQNEFLTVRADDIFDYGNRVARYCPNQLVLKNEILAFIDGLPDVIYDYDQYIDEMILEAKKRCGIYPLDEKTLSIISSEVEKAQALIEKLDAMQRKIDTYRDLVKSMTSDGKKELQKELASGKKELKYEVDKATQEINDMLTASKKDIIDHLDEYIKILESSLKKSSDQVFNSILEQSSSKLREIKLSAESLSTTTTSELLRIQNATQESVSKLKQYVENEPQLQELLKNASDDDKIRETLLNISSMQANKPSAVVTPVKTEGILIPGNDRLVIPANPSVIIPDSSDNIPIIRAFDERIPFEKRIDTILQEKKIRESNGEIYHDMTEEIIRCVLEGDWVYLWGPSGCGKSYSIKQIAELIGIDMIDNGKITDKYSIMAYNDANGNFRATQAFVSLVYGKLLLLDEFDNGNPDTQVVLNELYSGLLDVMERPNKKRFVTFAEDMTVAINPNFRMISAGNTTGEGENQAFSSRGKIDESVQQRMTPKRFWYDNRVEQKIFGEYENWYNIFANFRKACDSYAKREGLDTPPGITTTRDAAAIVKYIKHNSKSVDQIFDEKFVQIKSPEYLDFIQKKFREYYNIDRFDEDSLSLSNNLSKISEVSLAKKLILKCRKERSE